MTGTVLIPSIALLVMWIAGSGYLLVDAIYVRAVASSVQDVSIPAVTSLGAVQQERQLSLIYLERPQVGLRDLQAQQQSIDRSMSTLRSALGEVKGLVPDEIGQRMNQVESSLDQLPVIRAEINLRTISKEEVNAFYNNLLDTATELFDSQARMVPDAESTQGGMAAVDIFRASDQMSRAASLASSAFAAGQLSAADHSQFAQLVGSYRAQLAKIAPHMAPEAGATYRALTSSAAWQHLSAAEDSIIAQGPGAFRENTGGLTVRENDWRDLTTEVSGKLLDLTVQQSTLASGAALHKGNVNLWTVIIGSIAALLAAVASIWVAVRVSRTLVDRTLMTRLERLRNDSLELARTRLPSIVNRLKEGEPVDVSAELPRLDHGKDEIGQVAEAFNIAQLTAVQAAASEAKARSGVNNVFLGIAHRNQGLVHRQLQILDRMESREENPEQLRGLFQLDHLATRARRTTENLIILGGKQPGRRWRKPVWLMDVLRAAVSETEHYSRVEVENVPQVALIGSAVADTIHLVAELVDNATTFSPPGSQVHMTSTVVARGVVVDVADQGLGMKDDVREWANRMMSEPPEFDAMALKADSSLGLFVVARLAARLGLKVMFDSSRYGGTRATILIPSALLANTDQVAENADPEFPGAPASAGPDSQEQEETGRPAGANGMGRHEHNGAHEPARRVPVERPSGRHTEPDSPAANERTGTISVVAAEPAPVPAPSPRPKRSRSPLPQREPQQNLVAQLRDDPESDSTDYHEFSGRTRNTLSAFHKGTRRGRDADAPENPRATTD
nr:nitrate- and nitrite sensing domain-containing protein [Amycolatopsis granulosa]